MSRVGGRHRKSLRFDEPVLTPERKLWRAVLEQAYLDAELSIFVDETEVLEHIVATRFLRAESPIEAAVLKMVCDYAEIPWDRLVPWARKRYPFLQLTEDQAQKAW
jgi:hypothetical protein